MFIENCVCLQNDTPALAPASLQLLQQLQATTSAATPVAAGAGASALSSVQHQLLLQQHLGLGAATPAHAAAPAVPSPPEINPANLQGLATLASLSNTAGEYGWCRFALSFIFVPYLYLTFSLRSPLLFIYLNLYCNLFHYTFAYLSRIYIRVNRCWQR